MIKMIKLVIFSLLMFDHRSVLGGTEAEMRALLDAKLQSSDYSPRVRPIKDTGNVLTVSECIQLNKINSDIDWHLKPNGPILFQNPSRAKTSLFCKGKYLVP